MPDKLTAITFYDCLQTGSLRCGWTRLTTNWMRTMSWTMVTTGFSTLITAKQTLSPLRRGGVAGRFTPTVPLESEYGRVLKVKYDDREQVVCRYKTDTLWENVIQCLCKSAWFNNHQYENSGLSRGHTSGWQQVCQWYFLVKLGSQILQKVPIEGGNWVFYSSSVLLYIGILLEYCQYSGPGLADTTVGMNMSFILWLSIVS